MTVSAILRTVNVTEQSEDLLSVYPDQQKSGSLWGWDKPEDQWYKNGSNSIRW